MNHNNFKRLRFFIFLMFLVALVTDCAMGNYISIPPPQPGLVLPINSSPGVWAECWLFEGKFSQRKLIIPHPTERGKLAFAETPLKHFIIGPPMTAPYSTGVMSTVITVPLLLSAYPADYTLLVFYKNFRDWVVKIETRRFSTSGNPFNEYYISGGRKVYADKVIKLARCKPYEYRQFKFHKTLYPGYALKKALGLP